MTCVADRNADRFDAVFGPKRSTSARKTLYEDTYAYIRARLAAFSAAPAGLLARLDRAHAALAAGSRPNYQQVIAATIHTADGVERDQHTVVAALRYDGVGYDELIDLAGKAKVTLDQEAGQTDRILDLHTDEPDELFRQLLAHRP